MPEKFNAFNYALMFFLQLPWIREIVSKLRASPWWRGVTGCLEVRGIF
jgi:hypothetical protein